MLTELPSCPLYLNRLKVAHLENSARQTYFSTATGKSYRRMIQSCDMERESILSKSATAGLLLF